MNLIKVSLVTLKYISKNTPNISRADEVPLNFILGCDLFEIGYSF
jgi:hypothetical protein